MLIPFCRMRLTSTALLFAITACSSPPASTPTSSNEPAAPSASSAASAATPPPASSSGSASSADAGSPRERLMRNHFKEATVIRNAVINGNLSEAVAPAQALAQNEGLGKIDPSWQSSIDVLEYAAKRIQRSSDIPALAVAISDIGIACGACHKAAGGPKVQAEPAPPNDGTLAGRMHRHAWATERLWEGIYAPSDAAWKAGASALSGEPFPKEVLEKGDVHARSSADRFKGLVPTLAAKKTPQERGQAYASLLETCSACHTVTRKPKGAPAN
ncbi:MAG: hypothetical protein U0270_11305 [Labilithrix sp.]